VLGYPLYNIMLIKYTGGVAERIGLGKILKSAWRRANSKRKNSRSWMNDTIVLSARALSLPIAISADQTTSNETRAERTFDKETENLLTLMPKQPQ
jgi:hypothetical protein